MSCNSPERIEFLSLMGSLGVPWFGIQRQSRPQKFAYYVGNNGPPWLYRGDCPPVVAGIPGVWCFPSKPEEIAIGQGMPLVRWGNGPLCPVSSLGICIQEWRMLDALSSLYRRAWSSQGLLPKIRSRGKPRSWSHQYQVRGDPGKSEMEASLSSRICGLEKWRPESWALLISSQ